MFKRLLNDSLSLVFGNLDAVFKVAGSWFVLQFVLSIAILTLTGQMPEEIGEAAPSATTFLLSITMLVLFVLSSSSIGVAWHRFGLLGEHPQTIHLTYGKTELAFTLQLLKIFLISFLVMLPVGVIFALVSMAVSEIVGLALLVILFLFVVLPRLMRLNLILPAAAVERPLTLKEAYALGDGLGWKMLWATIVLSLPFSLVSVGLQFILSVVGGGLPVFLLQMKVMILNVLLQIIFTVLAISVITAGYRIATERVQNSGGGGANGA